MVKRDISYAVFSQSIIGQTPEGERYRPVHRGKYRLWQSSKDIATNVRQSILHAISRLRNDKVGANVYIVPVYRGVAVKDEAQIIFQSRLGYDGFPWYQFAGPAGNYWKLKLGF